MEDVSESDCEDSDSSGGSDTYTVASGRQDSVHSNILAVSGNASNSHEALIEDKKRDGHHTNHLDDQAGSSRNFGNEVVERGVARTMEQGDVTLRQWLDKPERPVDLSECLHIFRQIVDIVKLAHSQGIIVHSVRPSCFLISASNRISFVKPVSFPSGCSDLCVDALNEMEMQNSRSLCIDSRMELSPAGISQGKLQISDLQSSSTSAMHQTTIGELKEIKLQDSGIVKETEESNSQFHPKETSLAEFSWYTSPEEYTGAPSSISSDVYRLGVLLFELVCPFTTIEEKLSTMLNLRHRVLPPQLLLKWPKEASFCLWLLHPQSSTRPRMRCLLPCGANAIHLGE